MAAVPLASLALLIQKIIASLAIARRRCRRDRCRRSTSQGRRPRHRRRRRSRVGFLLLWLFFFVFFWLSASISTAKSIGLCRFFSHWTLGRVTSPPPPPIGRRSWGSSSGDWLRFLTFLCFFKKKVWNGRCYRDALDAHERFYRRAEGRFFYFFQNGVFAFLFSIFFLCSFLVVLDRLLPGFT